MLVFSVEMLMRYPSKCCYVYLMLYWLQWLPLVVMKSLLISEQKKAASLKVCEKYVPKISAQFCHNCLRLFTGTPFAVGCLFLFFNANDSTSCYFTFYWERMGYIIKLDFCLNVRKKLK